MYQDIGSSDVTDTNNLSLTSFELSWYSWSSDGIMTGLTWLLHC
jgi:hypothetical protein